MKRLVQRLFQALPKSVDAWLRSLSLKINGAVLVARGSSRQLIAPSDVGFGSQGIVEFVQESYKWPTSVIMTPLGTDHRFHDVGVSVATVRGALLAGDGRAFDSRHRLILESLATHDYQAINPGRWAHAPTRELSGPVLALNWWSGNTNLYHWLRDVFSRAYVLTGLPGEAVTIVCPKDPAPFQRHGLDALLRRHPGCRLEEVDQFEKVRVETLLQPCVNPYVRGNGFLRREVADFIRDTYLDGVEPGQGVDLAYISRSQVGSRRLLDELEMVKRVSERFPIQVTRIEQLPFADQLSMMSGTKVLMGVYGAGLVHVLFTRRGGLIDIHNGDSRETHFGTLAAGIGVSYAMVQGGPADRNQDFHLGDRGIDTLLATLESTVNG
jgi:capsular polysaccharide biosynthesis protein